MFELKTLLRGPSHKLVSKRHHSVNFQNIKNARCTFCRQFHSELPAVSFIVMTSLWHQL